MDQVITTDYDGCGKCLVGVRRLSRMKDASNSPEKQLDQVLSAAESVGGHIIAWADDWEVSGATDPLTRPGLGPWLRGEAGPYSGIVGAAVDRIGRNQRDVLNTAYTIHESGRLLITYGHDGPWALDDPTDEMRLSMESFGAQMELRAIQKRNRDETHRARTNGKPKQKNRYGYRYVRLIPNGKVDHVEIDPVPAEILRNVAERILADDTGEITVHTEAARLSREGIQTPEDYRAIQTGRKPKGFRWNAKTLKRFLTDEGSLGYLMHNDRPVIGPDGHPRRLADPLWDRATRDALIKKTAPKRKVSEKERRAPKSTYLLSGRAYCGNCGRTLYIYGRKGQNNSYGCDGRVLGVPSSQNCSPAPNMSVPKLNKLVTAWFMEKFGSGQLMKRQYDPGTGYAARIAELEADRKRLREDRSAGLYDSEDDAEWYRQEYARMGREIAEFKKLPERPAGMRMVPTGKTVADEWNAAKDDAARRELLSGFNVRVTLFPTNAEERVRITGADLWAQAV
ncbi:recombinase family protein [Streptomyces sp. NBC_00474]|uniref:recombinase family protein n=1 Tax=Streptomyces sp. NBC_00474 TaxID=2975754 RepID=UPI00225A7B70|nr:recombinase family protein [Streptomyces sp. NBC_00474]MCX5050989.1 recombinase family protein [Streptomyces sp. NBC_00474]